MYVATNLANLKNHISFKLLGMMRINNPSTLEL